MIPLALSQSGGIVCTDDNRWICKVDPAGSSHVRNEAIAAEIVKRWNEHVDSKSVLRVLESAEAAVAYYHEHEGSADLLASVRATIEKMKGKR